MNVAVRIMTFGVGRQRSWKREALWMAGSAGAGTVIGAATRGKKGATLGAISGGVARLILAVATR